MGLCVICDKGGQTVGLKLVLGNKVAGESKQSMQYTEKQKKKIVWACRKIGERGEKTFYGLYIGMWRERGRETRRWAYELGSCGNRKAKKALELISLELIKTTNQILVVAMHRTLFTIHSSDFMRSNSHVYCSLKL